MMSEIVFEISHAITSGEPVVYTIEDDAERMIKQIEKVY